MTCYSTPALPGWRTTFAWLSLWHRGTVVNVTGNQPNLAANVKENLPTRVMTDYVSLFDLGESQDDGEVEYSSMQQFRVRTLSNL